MQERRGAQKQPPMMVIDRKALDFLQQLSGNPMPSCNRKHRHASNIQARTFGNGGSSGNEVPILHGYPNRTLIPALADLIRCGRGGGKTIWCVQRLKFYE